jgi:hypothetical protein
MPTVVQTHATTGIGSSSPLQTSFSSLPTAGNAVIVAIAITFGSPPAAVSGVTDNQGNTYQPVITKTDNADMHCLASLWWCAAVNTPSGTFTVSAAYSGTAAGGNCAIGIMEVNGITAVDQAGSANDSAGSITTLTATCTGPNTNAGDLVVGGVMTNYYGTPNSITSPPNTGYSSLMVVPSGVALTFGYKILSAIETSSVQASWTTAYPACSVVATFSPPALGNQLMGQICL